MTNKVTSVKKIILIAFWILIMIALVFTSLLAITGAFDSQNEIYFLNSRWDLYADGKFYENVSPGDISDSVGRQMNRLDFVHLERDLSDLKPGLQDPVLMLTTYYTAASVYIDDELIYTVEVDRLKNESFIGCGIYYVELPYDYENHTLGLSFSYGENNSSANLNIPEIGACQDLSRRFIREHFLALAFGYFLIIFGLIFLLFSLYFKRLLPEIKGQTVSSLICIDIGIFTLSTFYLTPLFFSTNSNSETEYISMFLLAPLTILLLYQIQDIKSGSTFIKRFFIGAIVLGFAYPVFAFIMHVTNIAHLTKFRVGYFIFTAFMVIALFVIIISNLRHGKRDSLTIMQLTSPSLLCVFALLGIMLYSFTDYSSHAWQNELPMLVCCFGGYLFAVFRFTLYLIMTQKMKPKQDEYLSLNRMAYIDALTGLSNRALITEVLEDLDTENDSYCLISLDLNDLKMTNDTWGHAIGDKLITSFANALRTSFPESAECCRAGGDEFMVIWKTSDKMQVESCLQKLSEALKTLDFIEPKVRHSAAWGYAFSNEFDHPDTHTVFLAADERMYRHKAAYKEQRKTET